MAMRILGSTPPAISRKSKNTAILIIIILLGLLGFWYFGHNKNNQATTGPRFNLAHDLSEQQIQNDKLVTAEAAVNVKNYKAAVDAYYGAASGLIDSKNYTQAEDVLKTCIRKVPDRDVPWDIYYTLSVTAKNLNDLNLQKSSLTTAISKAEQPNSGVDEGSIKVMKNQLQALK